MRTTIKATWSIVAPMSDVQIDTESVTAAYGIAAAVVWTAACVSLQLGLLPKWPHIQISKVPRRTRKLGQGFRPGIDLGIPIANQPPKK